jgi:hypothetical protein
LVCNIKGEKSLRVCEKRVLRSIFGPKRDEVMGGWRKVHNEQLHGLCFSPSTIGMIKLKRMRWAGYIAQMGELNVCRLLVEGRETTRKTKT